MSDLINKNKYSKCMTDQYHYTNYFKSIYVKLILNTLN